MFVKRIISFLLSIAMISSIFCVTSCASSVTESDIKTMICNYPDYYNGICGSVDTAFVEKTVFDDFECIKVVPNTESNDGGAINLDGWSWGGANINVNDYDKLYVVYKYESLSPVNTKMKLNIMPQSTFSSATLMQSEKNIESNGWQIAVFDITSARTNAIDGIDPIIMQMHLYPFGQIQPKDILQDDVMYISHVIAVRGCSSEVSIHRSYISGREKSVFGNTPITRAEACTIVARLVAGGDASVPTDRASSFSDVTSEKWYYKYVSYLESLDFLNSYKGAFLPDSNITRAEFAELVYKLGLLDEGNGNDVFSDVAPDHERADIIKAAARVGMINGYDNGDGTYSFKPDNTINRAEAVRMINNAYGRHCLETGLNSSVLDYFTDIEREHWAHADIIHAAIDHIAYENENGEHLWLCAFGDGFVNEDFDADFVKGEAYAAAADKLLRERAEQIRSSESEWSVADGGRVFYVSNDGSDENDGLSEETPIKTIRRMQALQDKGEIKSGDVVLFMRGDEWRERWKAKNGVTYSAYGEGEKPIINGNEFGDAADPSKWLLVDGTANIWKYNGHVLDVGNIIYNNGEKTVEKVVPNVVEKKLIVNGREFDPSTALEENDSFICEYLKRGENTVNVGEILSRLYVRCDEGNPGEVYDSIELAYRGNLISGSSNNTYDNLTIKYAGSHGIGMGTVSNVTVRNCEVCYIGGSAQYYSNGSMVRFGNGIEVYGGCDNFVIDNCYVYQCYDAGITHQVSSGGVNDVVHENVYFTNNVIEKCIYNIEFFMGKADDATTVRKMKNIVYKNNILAYSGKGWGMDPSRSASIKGWDHRNEAEDFVIEDNVFLLDYRDACDLGAGKKEWLPKLSGNTYVQKYANTLTKIGGPVSIQYKFLGNAASELAEKLGETDAKLYYVRENRA